MKLNIDNARTYLQAFDFKTLFIEELGWNNPKNRNAFPFNVKEGLFYRKAIAELSGATVYEITNEAGTIADAKTRDLVSKEIQKINYEHILIFIDNDRTQTIWRWVKKQDKKNLPREHYFSAGQTGDLFIGKLAGLLVDISEIENDITITDVAKKMQKALDVEKVTKDFFKKYQDEFIVFIGLIEGIDNDADKRWYASVILNRLMFIYFLQKKGFIDNGNLNYLNDKLSLFTKSTTPQNNSVADNYYNKFLKTLFFEGFAKAENQRSEAVNKLLGNIKYLNGGLFLKHKIEEKYPDINIPDIAFVNLLQVDEPKGLFERFSWSLDDTPGGTDNEINPDVLGYIFEKYINQKAFGAYYTRTEITEYLCEQTVYKLILDSVNEEELAPDLLKKAGLDKLPKARHYTNIAELLISLDAATCKKLVYGTNAVIPNLSLLDPACGSGAFLVAAMKTLINVYAAILGRIEFLGDKQLTDWKKEIEIEHTSIQYYIKKQIITNNLYGVDIMEEATEIAKLRLFLALVASANSIDQLEPLPNIDFNIMSGNSLIGLLGVDSTQFNKLSQSTKHRYATGKVVQKATLFNTQISQTNLFGEENANNYQQLINKKEEAINRYKNAHELGITDLQDLKDSIAESEVKANKILNQLLLEEFNTLGIKYEQVTWDETKNKEGKPIKRPLTIDDITALEPFHWGYEFSEIFRKKDGFDAIITNPPWEVFKPEAKEFFSNNSNLIQKNKTVLKDFEKQKLEILKDEGIKLNWLNFLSSFNHPVEYFKLSKQYSNQSSIINGKKAAANNNLYKLFTEQCFNLLKLSGYCGIVIPSSIYTDLGTMQIRKMLFEKTKITGMFCFENRKTVFENVDSRFKFVVLSFEKGNTTDKFPAAFMRHNVEELVLFPENNFVTIKKALIEKLSPDALAIFEFKSEMELKLFEKLYQNQNLIEWKDIELSREFNASDDDFRFNEINEGYRIYEGKMFWHFDSYFSKASKFISYANLKETHFYKKDDWKHPRIAIRRISANTNERTLVTTMIPPNSLTSHSLFVNVNKILNGVEGIFLTSLFNSFVLDYIVRNQATTNVTQFIINGLPIVDIDPNDKWYKPIIERAAKLICTTEEFAELWEDVMKTKWSKALAATQESDRNKLRAELDGIIAHIYGLTEEEFTYILSTFPIVPQAQKQLALEQYQLIAAGKGLN